MSPDHSTPGPGAGSVAWRRVGLFYALSCAPAAAIGAIFAATGVTFLTPAPLWVQGVLALLYMPAPLVAGLIIERVAGRSPLIRSQLRALAARVLPTLTLSALAILALFAAAVGITWLVPAAGRLAGTPAELQQALSQTVAAAAPGTAMDPIPFGVGTFLLLGAVGALTAGFTINGLVAFGEEYGWRGVIADELSPLGPLRSDLLTGLLWGLWHTPLILLGFNFARSILGTETIPPSSVASVAAAVGAMTLWTTALSSVLGQVRRATGTVIAPAVVHGGVNAWAGMVALCTIGGNPLYAAPAGLLGSVSAGVVAVLAAIVLPRRGSLQQRRIS